MMGKMSNQELVNKAMVTTDAIANAGKLNPEQANKFIDYVFDLSKLKDRVRTVKFTPDKMDIDKIGVGQRVALAKNEAVDPGRRRGVKTSKITLTPHEIMVPFEISDDFGEYNIEGEDVEDHIIKMMATQLGNDLEELGLDGDKLGPARIEDDIYDGGSETEAVKDTYMALLDGWLKKSRGGNVVDHGGINIQSKVFNDMINSMPEKYKRNKNLLKFFCSSTIEQNYRQTISSRSTAKGDDALSSMTNLTPFGFELVPIPMFNTMPRVTQHIVLSGVVVNQLLFKGIIEDAELVTPSTLLNTPVTPYVEGTDYAMDYTAGTIARIGTGAIGDGAEIKITYQTEAQLLFTEYRNLIFGICRDVRIEKDRDIYKGVNQYAITVKVSAEIENLEALVFGKNVGLQ